MDGGEDAKTLRQWRCAMCGKTQSLSCAPYATEPLDLDYARAGVYFCRRDCALAAATYVGLYAASKETDPEYRDYPNLRAVKLPGMQYTVTVGLARYFVRRALQGED